jgi:hypothetical protein
MSTPTGIFAYTMGKSMWHPRLSIHPGNQNELENMSILEYQCEKITEVTTRGQDYIGNIGLTIVDKVIMTNRTCAEVEN